MVTNKHTDRQKTPAQRVIIIVLPHLDKRDFMSNTMHVHPQILQNKIVVATYTH